MIQKGLEHLCKKGKWCSYHHHSLFSFFIRSFTHTHTQNAKSTQISHWLVFTFVYDVIRTIGICRLLIDDSIHLKRLTFNIARLVGQGLRRLSVREKANVLHPTLVDMLNDSKKQNSIRRLSTIPLGMIYF